MSLSDKQNRFALNLAMLYLEIERIGIKYTLGDAFRDHRLHGKIGEKKGYGHKNSCHKLRLAQDINLFHPDGSLVTDDTYHRELHKWWTEKCGGSPMIEHDGNHYSFSHNGML